MCDHEREIYPTVQQFIREDPSLAIQALYEILVIEEGANFELLCGSDSEKLEFCATAIRKKHGIDGDCHMTCPKRRM